MDGLYLNEGDAVKRLGGNKRLYLKLLKSFLGDKSFQNLQQYAAAGDRENAKMAAHTLKGLAANLSLVVLSEEAARIDHMLKEAMIVPQDLLALEDAMRNTVGVIEEMIALSVV
ncbi:MAG: Hpt domain-containing protein [Clostridiales bacterium]|nr:Hpt domain-containing protein [Clostridiales bacterium]